METEGELGLETGVKLGYLHTCQELPVLQLAKLIPELQGLYIHPMGTTQSIKNEKPDFLTIMQGKWMSPWKIELTSQEMETLSPELQAATRSIQEKIGRRNVAYPMPVGTHRCVCNPYIFMVIPDEQHSLYTILHRISQN